MDNKEYTNKLSEARVLLERKYDTYIVFMDAKETLSSIRKILDDNGVVYDSKNRLDILSSFIDFSGGPVIDTGRSCNKYVRANNVKLKRKKLSRKYQSVKRSLKIKCDIGEAFKIDHKKVFWHVRNELEKRGIFLSRPEFSEEQILDKFLNVIGRTPRKIMQQDSNEFFASKKWRLLRMKAFELHGNKCQCCGRGPKNGVILHVDHIKPRSKYPELEFDLSNLQILCEDCNLGKLNLYETDYR